MSPWVVGETRPGTLVALSLAHLARRGEVSYLLGFLSPNTVSGLTLGSFLRELPCRTHGLP